MLDKTFYVKKLPPLLSGKSQQNVLVLSGLITSGRRLQQLKIEKKLFPFDIIKFRLIQFYFMKY